MENYERVFIASSKIFSGFKVPINITLVDNHVNLSIFLLII